MPALQTAIWQNLLRVSSALQNSGLVVGFNGVLRSDDPSFFDLGANQRVEGGEPDEPKTSSWDNEQSGFYRSSEYADMDRSRDYTVKFLDGGLLQYYCRISNGQIVRQRLCFYQSPVVRAYDSANDEYDGWVADATDADEEARVFFGHTDFEYRDVASLRIEFAPDQYRSVHHPQTHLHINSIEGCRIPVTSPIGVATFFRFVVKNFYSAAWHRVESNLIDQFQTIFDATIDNIESTHLHIAVPTMI